MNQDQLWHQFLALPPDAQEKVRELILTLRAGYAAPPSEIPQHLSPLEDEPFIGMWQDREEMKDSVDWLRNLRVAEWGDAGASRDDS
jgi:hypothetical protein